MTEKTTVSETRHEINAILDRYGLSDSFNKCIIKQGEKIGLVQGAKAENFIFNKFEELVKFVDDNRTDKTNDAELNTLISGWIEEQDRITDQMEENEPQVFDESEIKKMSIAKKIDFANLLITFKLEKDFYGTLVKIGKALGYHQDEEGKEYISSRFSNCDEYLTDHSTKIPTPEPEFRGLIVEWIAKQNELLESLEEYERKEDMKADQMVQVEKEIETLSEEDLKTRVAQGYPVEAEDLKNQAELYYKQGKFNESELLYTRALAISEKALGPDNPALKTCLTNLALIYKAQGKYAEAEAIFLRTVTLLETALGPYHPDVATSINKLVGIYKIQGKYGDVWPLNTRIREILEKSNDIDNLDVAISLNDLAESYHTSCRYDKAESLSKRALAILEKSLGSEHSEVATFLNQLAEIHKWQHRNEEAEPLYRRALAISEKFFGSDHPEVAISLDSLAALYKKQGRYTEAEPLLRRALAISENVLRPDHPELATYLNNMGELYKAQGRYTEAEPLYKRALAIREKTLGIDHPYTEEVRTDLKTLQEENAIIRTTEGPHVEAADLDNLAARHYKQNRYEKAVTLYRQALAIRERSFGPDHPEVVVSLYNLADYFSLNRAKEAEPLYKRALAIMEKSLGSDHPKLNKYLTKLAVFYHWNNRYAEAEPLYVRALAILEKSFGSDHPEVATSLKNLALIYKAQGKYAEAEALYVRALAIREKSLSSGHPEIATSLKDLAELYDAQGRYTEAKPLFTRLAGIINIQLKKENISNRKYQFKGAGTKQNVLRVLPEEILETLVTVIEYVGGPSFVAHSESRPTVPIRVKDVYSGGNGGRAITLKLIDDRKLWSRVDQFDYLEIQDPPDYQPRTTGSVSANNFNFIFTCQDGKWMPA